MNKIKLAGCILPPQGFPFIKELAACPSVHDSHVLFFSRSNWMTWYDCFHNIIDVNCLINDMCHFLFSFHKSPKLTNRSSQLSILFCFISCHTFFLIFQWGGAYFIIFISESNLLSQTSLFKSEVLLLAFQRYLHYIVWGNKSVSNTKYHTTPHSTLTPFNAMVFSAMALLTIVPRQKKWVMEWENESIQMHYLQMKRE